MRIAGKPQTSQAAIIGASCRLPGADSLEAFWRLLMAGTNSVRPQPADRWSVERFLRPGDPAPGFAYSFAGGYLDKPLDFDPSPFGISPREAQQMDPQQRLLLEVVWQALEDAALPPASLAGQPVGVYVGASMVDYQNTASMDPSVIDSHFMTGNSLSILSNRISYIFDFKGPSFTVDSACSSSFVALKQAIDALNDGKIDLAVVAGVNLLLSPVPFIGFSQARMLSPTGLSRPFSEQADGYVRSEGAVVLVLRRESDALARQERVRGVIVGASVNSDGRTSGISLPSLEGQSALLDAFYDEAGIDRDQLAFIEAHGTGTKVGDPIEATAIGQSLGRKRRAPLPLGSVKSNIGHLEAASGLAGLLKAVLALENRVLPASLFLENVNENIDFSALNLAPNSAARALDLARDGRYAGICNYGFGGTNAHALVRAADDVPAPVHGSEAVPARILVVSAAERGSLADFSSGLADMIEGGASVDALARTLGHCREVMKHRLVLPLSAGSQAIVEALRSDESNPLAAIGSAARRACPVVFVFSGNGSQFPRMGQVAYASNARFREEITAIDQVFEPLAGWSIAGLLAEPIPAEKLQDTTVAQPLIYAIQSALVACLAEAGIQPEAVLGHSVGEVAAAQACGALSREDAVRLIYLRSKHQEGVRGLGRMLVVAADQAQTEEHLRHFGADNIEIAALNSATSTTVSGPADALKAFARHCRSARVATVALDIDYPFHSSRLDPLQAEMIEALAFLRPQAGAARFISSVTGDVMPGQALDAQYWWRNLRQTVRFKDALAAAATENGKVFLEIGPRAILTGAISENLRDHNIAGEVLASLTQNDRPDPVGFIIASLVANGATFDQEMLCGSRPYPPAALPGYAFQRQPYVLPSTTEAFNAFGRLNLSAPRHPLLGARMADGSPEWRNLVDPELVPYLSDHRVDGGVIVPAAGLIEMALAAGRDLFGDKPLELDEFDVLKALAIAQDDTREVSTRYSEAGGTIEIWSRKRFSTQDWVLHARGRIGIVTRGAPAPLPPPDAASKVADTAAEVYSEASRAGLDYGPLFQLVTASERDHVTTDAQLAAPDAVGLGAYSDLQVISPVSLDAAFHGLFISRPQKEGEKKAHLPVRFRKICAWRHGAVVRRSITLLTHETDRFKTVAITLLDADNRVVFSVEAAVLRALYLAKATTADRTFRLEKFPFSARQGEAEAIAAALARPRAGDANPPELPASWHVVRAFCVSLAHDLLTDLAGNSSARSAELVAQGRIPEASSSLVEAALFILDGFGLIAEGRVVETHPLPPPQEILSTLIANFPDANLEIRLCATALAHAATVLKSGTPLAVPPHLRDQLHSDSLLARPALAELRATLADMAKGAARALRILAVEPWSAALLHALRPLVRDGAIELTLTAPDRKAIDNARKFGSFDAEVEFLDLGDEAALGSPLPFDALVAVSTAMPGDAEGGISPALLSLLRAGAPVLVAAPGADATLDFLLGLHAGWFPAFGGMESGLARFPSPEQLMAGLTGAGITGIARHTCEDGLGALIVGHVPAPAPRVGVRPHAYALVGGDGKIARALRDGAELHMAADAGLGEAVSALATSDRLPPNLLYCVEDEPADAVEALAGHIEAIKALAEALEAAGSAARISVLTRGALDGDAAPCAVASGIMGFVRVAINEFPTLDLRLVEISSAATGAAVAGKLAQLLGFSGQELELVVDADGVAALRQRRNLLPPEALAEDERSVLRFEQAGRLDSFEWVKAPRSAPGEDEIEIEVAAVGLNFRDILVGLGVLDDDLLGAGLTAAALGFECSGRVVRLGAGVTHLAIGDDVMGFAANTFASHIVSPAWHFFKVPAGVSLEAAATIPVAFATAWFALIQRARIEAQDEVLIHGGAGGVGLAAIQIAKRAGSRVIATASSEERRTLARAAGADITHDSRQERFVEAIRAQSGGVDVVLNSLAGAAMQASFRLVRPFGRFVELGKRDYLDNTPLELRPFVRNIAYFGVDLDELLAHDRPRVEKMMQIISDQFASGDLKPLPYRVFESGEVAAAFRLMQASEHIGKIVVRPATTASRDAAALPFTPRQGVYLVIGGTSGLGFATARWLAEKGVGTIVLASRRGRVEEGLEPEVQALRNAGTTVLVEALDVTDGGAVTSLVKRLAHEHGPLRGVVHAAVMLDDGMISSLTPEGLRAVLRPKLLGALNLDAATAEQPLDFFVVYSSATTLIGSPGQGAYVAANAWLEGFARQRRAGGKPALAIGWGAISDVGIIARDKQLGRRLRQTTGVVGISASESLAHLGRLLALGNSVGPMQFYTNIAPGAAAEKLRLLRSAAFAGLGLARRDDDGGEGGDLVSAIEGKSRSEAITLVVEALKREISHILRMPEEQIDATRPLGELGLDSLMALELQLSIDRLCGADIPLVGAGDRRLADLAGVIVSSLDPAGGEPAAAGDINLTLALSGMHVDGGMSLEEAETLKRQMVAAGE